MKKIMSAFLALLMVFGLFGVMGTAALADEEAPKTLTVLFTGGVGDVVQVEDGLSFAAAAALKDTFENKDEVLLVDAGGVSAGSAAIMTAAGYDLVVPDAVIDGWDITSISMGVDELTAGAMFNKGGIKIAFIGVVPLAETELEDEEAYLSTIGDAVAKAAEANYVVAIGRTDDPAALAAVEGLDAVLTYDVDTDELEVSSDAAKIVSVEGGFGSIGAVTFGEDGIEAELIDAEEYGTRELVENSAIIALQASAVTIPGDGEDKSADDDADKSADDDADKSADDDADKSADDGEDKSADDGADKSADDGEDKSADDGEDKSADDGADKSTDDGADKSADDGADKSADDGADKSADDGADKSADDGEDKSADDGADKSADDGADKSTDDGADKSADDGEDKGADDGADKSEEEKKDAENASPVDASDVEPASALDAAGDDSGTGSDGETTQQSTAISWEKGTTDLVVTLDHPVSKIIITSWGNRELETKYYSLSNGDKTVTIFAKDLNGWGNGNHVLTFEFSDGAAAEPRTVSISGTAPAKEETTPEIQVTVRSAADEVEAQWKSAGLDVDAVKKALSDEIVKKAGFTAANVKYYDVGSNATADQIAAAGGVSVTLPYPDGTKGEGYDFVVAHRKADGSVEIFDIGEGAETASGIQIKVDSLSPFAVGYKSSAAQTNSGAKSPATGDETPIWLFVLIFAVLVAALAVVIVLVVRKNKKKQQDQDRAE